MAAAGKGAKCQRKKMQGVRVHVGHDGGAIPRRCEDQQTVPGQQRPFGHLLKVVSTLTPSQGAHRVLAIFCVCVLANK